MFQKRKASDIFSEGIWQRIVEYIPNRSSLKLTSSALTKIVYSTPASKTPVNPHIPPDVLIGYLEKQKMTTLKLTQRPVLDNYAPPFNNMMFIGLKPTPTQAPLPPTDLFISPETTREILSAIKPGTINAKNLHLNFVQDSIPEVDTKDPSQKSNIENLIDKFVGLSGLYIVDLPALTYPRLDFNQLSAIRLKFLNELSLVGMKFTNVSLPSSNLVSLCKLSILYCNFDNHFLSSLSKLPALTSLNLEKGLFVVRPISEENLPSANPDNRPPLRLAINRTSYEIDILPFLNHPNISELEMKNFPDETLKTIPKYKQLTKLVLNQNPVETKLKLNYDAPELKKTLAALPALEHLEIVNGPDLRKSEIFTACRKLKTLKLSETPLDNENIEEIGKQCTELVELTLSNCPHFEELKGLEKSPLLRRVDLTEQKNNCEFAFLRSTSTKSSSLTSTKIAEFKKDNPHIEVIEDPVDTNSTAVPWYTNLTATPFCQDLTEYSSSLDSAAKPLCPNATTEPWNPDEDLPPPPFGSSSKSR